jgi:hypothetical protein
MSGVVALGARRAHSKLRSDFFGPSVPAPDSEHFRSAPKTRQASCGRLMRSTDRLQEEGVMTWSDSQWVLIYSVLVVLFTLLWAYVPA